MSEKKTHRLTNSLWEKCSGEWLAEQSTQQSDSGRTYDDEWRIITCNNDNDKRMMKELCSINEKRERKGKTYASNEREENIRVEQWQNGKILN